MEPILEEKLNIIKEVVEKRKEGYMARGCPANWFYSIYEKYNQIQSKNFPKYIVIAPNEEQLEHWRVCMLTSYEREIRYNDLTGTSYIYGHFDERDYIQDLQKNGFKKELLWRNGYLEETFGKLSVKIITEEEYVEGMYKEAVIIKKKLIKV